MSRLKEFKVMLFNAVKSEPNATVLQIDFAMSYTCEFQDEIQGVLWVRNNVNLLTAAFYHGDQPCKCLLIVTDSTNKYKESVYTFVKKLFTSEKDRLKEKIMIFSDGPTAEFKNKFMVKLVHQLSIELGREVSWSYFATSQRKGIVDGIGGSAKSLARRDVKSRKRIVKNSLDFAASDLMPNVKTIHISQEDIDETIKIDNPWSEVIDTPGILKCHIVVCRKSETVSLYLNNMQTSTADRLTAIMYETENEQMEMNDNNVIEKCMKGEWVVVMYDNKNYPGVTKLQKELLSVSCGQHFQINGNGLLTSTKFFYQKSHIIKKISPPIPIDARNSRFEDTI